MNHTTNPNRANQVTAAYAAIVAFQRKANLSSLRLAQIRLSLAEHLADTLLAAPALPSVVVSADRATLLRAAEALQGEAKRLTGEFNDSDILHEDGPAASVATWKRAAEFLRRMAAETQDGIDLADRLEAALTERFTELGNPFSEMRRHEQGPDGWPASHPVGPNKVAEVLRELMAEQRPAVGEQPAETQDSLPAWLYQRFMPDGVGWENLDANDRSYWEHHARAVRRAVARDGFKADAARPAVAEQPDTQTREADRG